VAELRFAEPPGAERLEQTTAAVRNALSEAGMALAQAFTSLNGAQLVCIIDAADEGAVRGALEAVEPAPVAIWSCTEIEPVARG
jgi:hypothetical protein